MRRALLTTAFFAAALLMGGCAGYEYDIVRPPELAQHIGSAHDQVLAYKPLEYRLRTVESRLVMQIFNPTPEPLTLAGERSYIVDPGGQSHPLRSQTIAPNTFIKLILPPMRPGYYQSNPTIGIGLGVGFSRVYPRRYGYPGMYPFDEPRYYTYYDESDTTYWTWEGESDIRLHLVYRGGRETVEHDFVIHREKK